MAALNLRNVAFLTAGAMAGAWYGLYRLGRSSGSSASERSRVLPGDDVVATPHLVTDHAISIAAPAEDVWPWLLQMGWHRGGWYTHRWVDRLLFPNNEASAEELLPEYQGLAVGDLVPDGAPETKCYFVVHTMEPGKQLVLHSTSHLPPQLTSRPDVELNWIWTFSIEPEGYHCSRLHFRSRIALQPWWLRLGYQIFLVPADHVMAGSMCRGIKQRAERLRDRAKQPSETAVASSAGR